MSERKVNNSGAEEVTDLLAGLTNYDDREDVDMAAAAADAQHQPPDHSLPHNFGINVKEGSELVQQCKPKLIRLLGLWSKAKLAAEKCLRLQRQGIIPANLRIRYKPQFSHNTPTEIIQQMKRERDEHEKKVFDTVVNGRVQACKACWLTVAGYYETCREGIHSFYSDICAIYDQHPDDDLSVVMRLPRVQAWANEQQDFIDRMRAARQAALMELRRVFAYMCVSFDRSVHAKLAKEQHDFEERKMQDARAAVDPGPSVRELVAAEVERKANSLLSMQRSSLKHNSGSGSRSRSNSSRGRRRSDRGFGPGVNFNIAPRRRSQTPRRRSSSAPHNRFPRRQQASERGSGGHVARARSRARGSAQSFRGRDRNNSGRHQDDVSRSRSRSAAPNASRRLRTRRDRSRGAQH